MLLLEYGRSLGLKLTGLHYGRHVSSTSIEKVADAMRSAGATVKPVPATIHTGTNVGYSISQWEISFPVDTVAAL